MPPFRRDLVVAGASEKAAPARKLAAQAGGRQPGGLARRYASSAGETADAAETLRRFPLEAAGEALEEAVPA